MSYQHHWEDGEVINVPLGKIVCVGRNYADHARELNNPVPSEPILFIKPATAAAPMVPSFSVPTEHGSCHVETEMALLIGESLCHATKEQAHKAVLGVGLGFDLTLRDLQNTLKEKGHPWEKSKAFDGSCPLSSFISTDGVVWDDVDIRLLLNGSVQQQGNSENMITPVIELLAYISQFFTLLPGDVVMTGTPAGVGPLQRGDQLEARLNHTLTIATQVT